MAAMGGSEEQVRLVLGELEKKVAWRLRRILKTKSDEIATQFETHVNEIATHRAEILDQQKRIEDLINDGNAERAEIVAEILKHRGKMSIHETAITEQNAQMKKHEEVIDAQAIRASQALNETQELDRRIQTLTTGMDEHTNQAGELFQAGRRSHREDARRDPRRLREDAARRRTHGGRRQGADGRWQWPRRRAAGPAVARAEIQMSKFMKSPYGNYQSI